MRSRVEAEMSENGGTIASEGGMAERMTTSNKKCIHKLSKPYSVCWNEQTSVCKDDGMMISVGIVDLFAT